MTRVVKTMFVSAALLAACGDDGGRSGVTIVDGNGGGDAGPVECKASASYGSPTPTTQEAHSAQNDGGMTDFWVFLDINQDPTPDILLVDLYNGYGAFEAGIPAAGTSVQLTGDESGFDTCGACVSLQVDYTENGPAEDQYIADGGTLNLTSASATSLAGNLSNVTLRHVNVDSTSGATTPHSDGCTATLSSVAFSATPEPDSSAKAGRWRIQLDKRR